MVQSVDGKISSGDTDELDVDKDWKHIPGLMDGEALHTHGELKLIKTLELIDLEKLENSFFRVKYKIKNWNVLSLHFTLQR